MEGVAEAQSALQTYEGLGNVEKAKFLESFQLANPGKTKNWGFVASFHSNISVGESAQVG